jgi:hypothetical protein
MPTHAGSLRNWTKRPSALHLILDFDGFRLRRLNTLNNYAVAADRVVVAAELDKFSRNMSDPAALLVVMSSLTNFFHNVIDPEKDFAAVTWALFQAKGEERSIIICSAGPLA